MNEKERWVVGITGASGAIYGVRLVQSLLDAGHFVHLLITEAGWRVLKEELDWQATKRQDAIIEAFGAEAAIQVHPIADIGATIASGSFRVQGMIIMPCSMGTLSSIAHGASDNLMARAADVMMKEGRPLVLVPRETPMHAIHLENMLKLSKMGVKLIPAMPAFYHKPKTLDDIVNFLVGKVLDSLDIDHQLFTRWGDSNES
ncbi:MAG: UbiX family flavin prenyltransferase [Paenibacillus sp.]|uniref:Flavin prenyltransferase UbiX n=1 Tax=Paenibacillus aquistagni TaxID=1852522 RepID=A0A1X7JHU1_9BACL|nr:UbiX family flavin prenyltransferase [Paenibacillus aquistagni]MBR2568206.1 UbiX family flavin prenyltransferase [Paenibacillus sp.]NMM54133.1 UbiX family flavin prenyltransferase [Paenibacillus aquistagni]SMG26838.1 4-hydroxy-3-polyprenylbenzoate decarboxylase [Paenibacillus aquistagni]